MGKLVSALKAGVASFGAKMGEMFKAISGLGKVMDGWNGIYGGILDGWEWTMQQADFAWDFTRNAAVHVAQDVDRAVGITAQAAIHVGQDLGKIAVNNPVSLMGSNLYQHLIGDHRPRIDPKGGSKTDAKNAVEAAKNANPAELAAVKAAYIKNDPVLVERYVGAETLEQRTEIRGQMSPKAQAWVDTLTASDLWSMKGKSSLEIAAHMSGDKVLSGVKECTDYYGASKSAAADPSAPKPEVVRDKTVAERSAERKAGKRAKRDAANGVTPEVAGAVPGQAPEPKSNAQQEVINFFGPRVAKPEEVSEYSQSSLPVYRPPVPIMRKAIP